MAAGLSAAAVATVKLSAAPTKTAQNSKTQDKLLCTTHKTLDDKYHANLQ